MTKRTKLKIAGAQDKEYNKWYDLYLQGNGDWTVLCKCLDTHEDEKLRIMKHVLIRSSFFEQIFYGENSNRFKHEVSEFTFTKKQLSVFKSIIIPFFYKQSVVMCYNEEFIHAYAIAKYLQIDSLLEEMDRFKRDFTDFGLLYEELHMEYKLSLTCPAVDFFEELDSKGNVTFDYVQQAIKRFPLADNMETILCWPSKFVLQLKWPSESLEAIYTQAKEFEDDDEMKKAITAYTLAAEFEHAPSIMRLAYFYVEGVDVKKSHVTAVELYLKAAAKNHIPAMSRLACLYIWGDDKVRNLEQAKKWLDKGVEGEDTLAFYFMAMHSQGSDIECANTFFKKAVKQDHSFSKYYLGLNFLTGNGIREDVKQGHNLIKEAAKAEVMAAMLTLGQNYEYGFRGRVKPETAVYWYNKAQSKAKSLEEWYQQLINSDLPIGDLLYHLGRCYARGFGVKQDLSKAFDLFLQSKTNKALVKLGQYKASGMVSLSEKSCMNYFNKADFKDKTCFAAFNIALHYEFGFGCERNETEAEQWYYKGMEEQDALCCLALALKYKLIHNEAKFNLMFEKLEKIQLNRYTHWYHELEWLKSLAEFYRKERCAKKANLLFERVQLLYTTYDSYMFETKGAEATFRNCFAQF